MLIRKQLSRVFALFGVVSAWIMLTPIAPAQPPNGPDDPTTWKLVFSDEFEGPELNRNTWENYYWWGERSLAATGEEQYYADDAFEFQDGYLRIRAERREMEGFQYTSGMISSRPGFAFKYGYIEARVRPPAGQGLWPAVWLLPVNGDPPEIDIVELLGHEPTYAYLTNHYVDPFGNPQQVQWAYIGPDFTAGFHTFGVEWAPEQITWYIDGVERWSTQTGVSRLPMYIIISLAVGGGWAASPDESTPFPSYFDVDYVRVYQRAASPPSEIDTSPGSTRVPFTHNLCVDDARREEAAPAVGAMVVAGTGEGYCRSLVENGVLVGDASQLEGMGSLRSKISQAASIAVLPAEEGKSAPTDTALYVCMLGSGDLVFLGEDDVHMLEPVTNYYEEGGYTCTFLGRRGVLALIAS